MNKLYKNNMESAACLLLILALLYMITETLR